MSRDGVATIGVLLPAGARQLSLLLVLSDQFDDALETIKTLRHQTAKIEQHLLVRCAGD